MEFNIRFGGFYYSEHDQIINSMIESYFDEDEEVDYDKINFRVIHEAYCKEYLTALLVVLKDHYKWFEWEFKYGGLFSPREYNFRTDEILAEVNKNEARKILAHMVGDQELVEFIDEQSISRDGFMSFYEGFGEVAANLDIFMDYCTSYWINKFSAEIRDEMESYNIHELLCRIGGAWYNE